MSRASKIRSALEQALELCNSMSLEELNNHPTASLLVPVLHDLLEQDEECIHTFNNNRNRNEDGELLCTGCGISEYDIKIVERGPWKPIRYQNSVYLLSDDFHHDVHMTISGDFGSPEQKYQYAREIANRLNSFGK